MLDGGADGGTDAGADGGPRTDGGDGGQPDSGLFDGGLPGPPTYRVHLVLPPEGVPYATPLAMNDDGVVVGTMGTEPWAPDARPFRATADDEVLIALDVPEPPHAGYARGISEDGAVIVGEQGFRPQRWALGRVELEVPDGWFSGVAFAIGRDGTIVGSFAEHDDALPPNPIGSRPLAWSPVDRTPIELRTFDPEEPLGSAWAINGSGVIVGTLSSSTGFVAVRWSAIDAAPTVVGGRVGASLSEARAINERGDVVGLSRVVDEGTFESHAWLQIDGAESLTELPFLDPERPRAEALGVDDERRVVGTSAFGDDLHAVLWIDAVAHDLNDRLETRPPELTRLRTAVAISERGIIAAEAVLTDGRSALAILRQVE